MNCMLCCRIFGCRSVIQLFLISPTGDPMVFHAGEFSGSARDRSQMFHWQVETYVAIKFPVNWIARIPCVGTPDLAAGVWIACEARRPCWCITGGVNRAARAGCSQQYPVRADDKPAKIRFL